MTALSVLAESHAEYREALAASAAGEARRAWSNVDPDDVSGSWLSLIGRVLSVVTGGQALAASRAEAYTTRALDLQGGSVEPAGEIDPRAFAGTASDGRSLFGLLYRPVAAFKISMYRGDSLQRSLAVGQATLDMAVRTQILDAGRAADGVAIAARPRVGYVRTLRGRGCSRCAVLAGRYYKYNSGFRRHPRCKCIHVPAKGANAVRREGLLSDPREFFDSLTPEEQDRIFTKDGAQAIRDGADISQVVNARRGMTTAGTTTEGTARGFAGHRLQGAERLMPETIYRIARSREETIDLLRLHGYII